MFVFLAAENLCQFTKSVGNRKCNLFLFKLNRTEMPISNRTNF